MTSLNRIAFRTLAAGAALLAVVATAWTVQPTLAAQAAGQSQPQAGSMPGDAALDYIAGQHLRVREDSARGLFLPNPMNGFDASVAGTGVQITDGRYELPEDPNNWQPDTTPCWSLGWSTESLGRVDASVEAADGEIDHGEFDVWIDRGVALEHWQNLSAGLKQSFILTSRPAGEGELVVVGEFACVGLTAEFDAAHEAVVFRGTDGEPRLAYDGLKAFDAKGAELESRMVYANGKVELRVTDNLLTQYPVTIDPMASTPEWMYTNTTTTPGTSEGLRLGATALSLGDVNGDGYDDVMVGGGWYAETIGGTTYTQVGRLYGFHGSANGPSTTPDWEWSPGITQNSLMVGGLNHKCFGYGDFNSDGYCDLAVGISGYDGSLGADEGVVKVFYGSSSGLPTTPSLSITSPAAGVFFGVALHGWGDANGDGYDDLVVSATYYSLSTTTATKEGAVFVYDGSSSGISTTPSFTAYGEKPGDTLGSSVAFIGDVNGDGYDDLGVGAVGRDGAYGSGPPSPTLADLGYVIVWHGSASGVNGGTTGTMANAKWTVFGSTDNEGMGGAVAPAGDVNGDGYDDIVCGAWGYKPASTGYAWAGGVFVWHGSANGINNGVTGDHTNEDFASDADQANARLGNALPKRPGDINGDGYDDVLCGSWLYSWNGTTSRGGAFAWYGSSGGVNGGAYGYPTNADWFYGGVTEPGYVGWCDDYAGDVNKDGKVDVIVGCPTQNNGSITAAGKVYVFFGGNRVFHTANTYTVAEDAGNLTITVGCDSDLSTNVTVQYATANGSAVAGSDFTATSGTLTFTPGQTSKTIVVPILDNSSYENTETFTLTLSNPSSGVRIGIPATTTITIQDNDTPATPSIQFASATANFSESGGSQNLTVNLSNSYNQAVTVNYVTAAGSATAGSDYTSTSGQLNIPAGQTSGTISISVLGDTLDEADETFTVTLSSPSNATLGTPVAATVTIVDDDAAPGISLSASSYSFAENAGTVNIPVNLSAVSGRAVSVNYATSAGTANAGSDFTSTSGTLNIAAGQSGGVIQVALIDDTTDEPNQTFSISISSPNNATLGSPSTATITINDNDAAPTVQLTAANTNITEGNTSANVGVSLSAASEFTVTVNWAATAGTATAGSDFTAGSGTITFNPGVTAQSFNVAILDDSQNETDETINVALSTPGNATLGSPASGTVTINDNDGAPSLNFSVSNLNISENGGTASLTVQLAVASGLTVSVDYDTADISATVGSDYAAASGTLTFNPGVTSQVVAITISDDQVDESDETLSVTLSNPTNATLGSTGSATVTILDDEATPSVQFSTATSQVSEQGGAVVLTVTLSGASASSVTVDYATGGGTATAGADYLAASGTLTFLPGELSKNVQVTINDDTAAEPDETLETTLSNASNALLGSTQVHTITILTDPMDVGQVGNGSSGGGSSGGGGCVAQRGESLALLLISLAMLALLAIRMRTRLER